MFAKFFAALRRLTAAAESFAGSFEEADRRLRANLGLDVPAGGDPDAAPALPAAAEGNGRRVKGRA